MLPQPRRSRTRLVVLAACAIVVLVIVVSFLYVMSLGFESQTPMPQVTIGITPVAHGWQVTILSITVYGIPWDDVRFLVERQDGISAIVWNPSTTDLDGGYNVSAHLGEGPLGSSNVSVAVTDTSGNGAVSPTDYFVITADPFPSATAYDICLVYMPAAALMCPETNLTVT